MVDHLAQCALAARADARVDAFAAQARLVAAAVGVGAALGPAALVRIALVFGDAAALAAEAVGVRTAR